MWSRRTNSEISTDRDNVRPAELRQQQEARASELERHRVLEGRLIADLERSTAEVDRLRSELEQVRATLAKRTEELASARARSGAVLIPGFSCQEASSGNAPQRLTVRNDAIPERVSCPGPS